MKKQKVVVACPYCQKFIEFSVAATKDEPTDFDRSMFDIDIIATGISKAHHERMRLILEMVEKDGPLSIENIIEKAMEIGIEPEKASEVIDRLNREGHIYKVGVLYHFTGG
jgi:replicative DNA helicase Mcm